MAKDDLNAEDENLGTVTSKIEIRIGIGAEKGIYDNIYHIGIFREGDPKGSSGRKDKKMDHAVDKDKAIRNTLDQKEDVTSIEIPRTVFTDDSA